MLRRPREEPTIDSTVMGDLICTICIEVPCGIVNQVHTYLYSNLELLAQLIYLTSSHVP